MNSAIISISKVRLGGLVAHAGFLREGGCALSPVDGNSAEEAIVGSCGRRTLANRLAADESRGVIGECVMQYPMPLPLHILQLLLGHPKIVPQFMYESLANLMTHFGLA
jgi:hypothetical protein